MTTRTFYYKGRTFKRINKKQAETAYNNGLTVVFCPVNIRPFTEYCFQHNISKENSENKPFNTVVNRSECYNCLNRETGRYMAFYIPVRTVDRFTGEAPTASTLGTVEEYDYSYIENKEQDIFRI